MKKFAVVITTLALSLAASAADITISSGVIISSDLLTKMFCSPREEVTKVLEESEIIALDLHQVLEERDVTFQNINNMDWRPMTFSEMIDYCTLAEVLLKTKECATTNPENLDNFYSRNCR